VFCGTQNLFITEREGSWTFFSLKHGYLHISFVSVTQDLSLSVTQDLSHRYLLRSERAVIIFLFSHYVFRNPSVCLPIYLCQSINQSINQSIKSNLSLFLPHPSAWSVKLFFTSLLFRSSLILSHLRVECFFSDSLQKT